MRRLITALLALALLLLTITGMKNADALARQSTSISLRWQQALPCKPALRAIERTKPRTLRGARGLDGKILLPLPLGTSLSSTLRAGNLGIELVHLTL